MKAQHYSIRLQNPNDAYQARPGQFVFDGNDNDDVIGFIYRVDGDVIEVVFFEPRSIPPVVKPIKIFLMPDQDAWLDMLHEILVTAEENIQWAWCDLLDCVE